jgi:hypothetical protein
MMGPKMNNETDDNGDEIAPESAASPDGQENENRPTGPWRKGMRSPNPGGRPKGIRTVAELRECAREKTAAMLEFISRTALNPKVSMNVRVQCAIEVLNRGYGKPQQSMDINHGTQDPLAQLLDQINGKFPIKTIEGSTERPALEAPKPILDNGQVGQEDSIPTELGTRKPSE